MSTAPELRQRAEALAGLLPPLLAHAEHLAAAVLMGAHGRRRAGQGEEFWQYRAARPGDEARAIDWRRSARSDAHFVREKEWQAAQAVHIWVDEAQSMDFASDPELGTKGDRARLLALAAAVLLVRAGERVALAALGTPPRTGELQLLRITEALTQPRDRPDYGAPEVRGMPPHARAVFISDFLGPLEPVAAQLTKAADRGVKGALVQILDPAEEAFPYDGRTIFESMGGELRHETLKAGELRGRYLERLAARKAELADLARATGWQFHCHHTSQSAQAALMWLYAALERRR
ncbi:Protein of unknown function DUF58 [Meinhardsimonia xiamenensis]|uniref:DUF58 domain-containing protein n=1 Tax=Meinhardsimonia xiamenensis TaxID=990712 RepID=A0A1G8Y2C2_9RHOB|nr:DUF58 domain-containing protein [Meinhardsimonia xiamenensis]PRX37117.1 uncharacterized protein DUF58 [Meinhardsimonia xiamenensis]SDJ96200.1 Protein of unknown function DUF58 [Meinhardsimonia xiamenensis]